MVAYSTWSPPTQTEYDECALSVLWSFTPLLHISRLSTCAYFGRIIPTLEDSHSQSTTFQWYGKRPKAKRDFSSSTLVTIWYHNQLGNTEWCQRFLSQVLIWESPELLELFRSARFWGNCGSPHLWDGFVSKSWPTHRCEHRQNLHVS